ncbi:MAG: AAA family ATPase [Gammaproteobacteria bacterium]
MQRALLADLVGWISDSQRKPLVIRGARQVGKTWIVREFARLANKTLIEINFEKTPHQFSLFLSNDPKQIILELSAAFELDIKPAKSLLFLDEIQAMPEILAKLRWFAEEMPELPIIAAGSLLEFILEQHEFSMPVGRIQYMHLEPMSFEEFLQAMDRALLYRYLKEFSLAVNQKSVIPESIHLQLTKLFKEYIIIGGMPAAVLAWVKTRTLRKVNQIHHDLLSTYRDDFSKYNTRLDVAALDRVMMAVPKMIGSKFVYSRVSQISNPHAVKKALSLLNKARLSHPIISSAANGIPLGAEIKEKHFKEIFIDIGLVSAMLGLNLSQLLSTDDVNLINGGSISEQVVGQLLRCINPSYVEPRLYYWQREEKGSNAEVDYVIEHGTKVIPIEVKTGSTGTLKSLHLFMGQKKLDIAVRISSMPLSIVQVDVVYPQQMIFRVGAEPLSNRSVHKVHEDCEMGDGNNPKNSAVKGIDQLKNRINYHLLSIPFYLTSEIHRLIQDLDNA